MKSVITRFLLLLSCLFLLAGCGGASSTSPSSSQVKQLATSTTAPANYAAVVQQLYVSYFGRPADAAGLTFYEDILASANAPTTLAEFNAAYSTNASVKTVIDGFGLSAESNALYGTDTNTLVNAIYRNLFNRDAEPAGLVFWAGLINDGTYTKGQAALIIMSYAQTTDLTAVNNKVIVATNFTDALVTPEQIAAYSGLAPNAIVRTMLGTVTNTTETTAFQSTVASTINTLVTPSISTYQIGGTVTGLTTEGLVIANGNETINVSANATSFNFANKLSSGTAYNVHIVSQPPAFTDICTVGNASGTANANISNITISCRAAMAAVSTLAGNGTGSMNGTGTAASFFSPVDIAIDSAGNLYVADLMNSLIRKITPAGVVTTLAGAGAPGNTNDTGTAASFAYPGGVGVDNAGNVYVADTNNNLIRKITPAGVVTTLAGSGTAGNTDDTGTAASFNRPSGIAADSSGNVYVADSGNNLIRKITPAGVVTTFAGSGSVGSTNDTGTAASFNTPGGIAVDSAGTLYVTDNGNQMIRKITAAGVVTTLAGSGSIGNLNGTGSAASFNYPGGIAVDKWGQIYVADTVNNVIRKITSTGAVTTPVGSGARGSDDGIGAAASFYFPYGVAVDASGNLYVSDNNNLIRKISPQ